MDCRDLTVPLTVSVQTIWEAFISYVSGTSFTNDVSFNRVLWLRIVWSGTLSDVD